MPMYNTHKILNVRIVRVLTDECGKGMVGASVRKHGKMNDIKVFIHFFPVLFYLPKMLHSVQF